MGIKNTWNNYYKKNDVTALTDRNLFKLELDSIKENFGKKIMNKKSSSLNILELGSGTGFLAYQLIQILNKRKINYHYTGIDFSQEAIKKAKTRKLKRCQFIEIDYLRFLKTNTKKFDYIISQRSIMAVMNAHTQKTLFKLIHYNLKKSGHGLFSECTKQSLKNLQGFRKKLSVEPYKPIWHSNYIDENMIIKIFSKYEKIDFCSTYYLITRIIYPYFKKPRHNTQLHSFASSLEQHGDYGLVKLFIVRP